MTMPSTSNPTMIRQYIGRDAHRPPAKSGDVRMAVIYGRLLNQWVVLERHRLRSRLLAWEGPVSWYPRRSGQRIVRFYWSHDQAYAAFLALVDAYEDDATAEVCGSFISIHGGERRWLARRG